MQNFSDVELIGIISYWMYLSDYHVYKIACKEIGMTDEKEVDKSWEKFYFPKTGRQVLLPEIRQELRKAYQSLRQD